jgi:hypothetical protein
MGTLPTGRRRAGKKTTRNHMSNRTVTATFAAYCRNRSGSITSLLNEARPLVVGGEWRIYGTNIRGADYLASLCGSVLIPAALPVSSVTGLNLLRMSRLRI